jgi:hypothetical protein
MDEQNKKKLVANIKQQLQLVSGVKLPNFEIKMFQIV